MGHHYRRDTRGDVLLANPDHPYRGRHIDTERQPGQFPVDAIPDDWFDPGVDRGPDDPDRWK